jgi:hypothetical protein
MTLRSRRHWLVPTAAGAFAFGAAACGAGINAVYESDVRFEHCMALDQTPDEKHSNRKGCWDEWVEYYTFGQTRDRVDYARRRQKQLSNGNDLRDEPAAANMLAQRAVPEPTTVLAPPPQMLTDAGKPPEVDAAADAAVIEPPAAACATQCRDVWLPCKQACTGTNCEKACAASYKRCMKRCF